MLRIAGGVIVGFIGWMAAWFGGETLLSAIRPTTFGANQRAFQSALEQGSAFTAATSLLLTHVLLASVVTLLAGFLAALVAGENRRAPLVLGCLLVAMGLLKAAFSWAYAPIWYHVIFTALLLPMAIVGGKLRAPHGA